MRALWIIGSGGHAKVVIEAVRLAQAFEVQGCLDDDAARHGAAVLGVIVSGDTGEQSLRALGVERAVIAVGSNPRRKVIADRLSGMVDWATIVHPLAWVASSAKIGSGSVVMAGAMVQPDAALGAHVILNTACSVDHDCVLGPFVHVAPGARLAGNVQVGTGAMVGIGASVIPGISLGEWCVVGAGSAVVRDVDEYAVVGGVPARSLG